MSSIPPNTALYIRNLNDKVKKEGSSTLLLQRHVLLKPQFDPAISDRTAPATVQSLQSIWQDHIDRRNEGSEDEGTGVRGLQRFGGRYDGYAKLGWRAIL